MTYKGDMDELLSAYLDDELGQRQQTEVKRLLQHDQEVAQRLEYLRKCRELLGALPREEAPEGMAEQIQQKLQVQQSTEIGSRQYYDETEGAKRLFLRKFASIAAMVALAGILGIVVYSILSPASNDRTVISENWLAGSKSQPESTDDAGKAEVAMARAGKEEALPVKPAPARNFSGKLLLATAEFSGVDAFIKKALVDNGAMLIELPVAPERKGSYPVRCGRMTLSMVLADMASIWDRFESATLTVAAENEEQVTIENVTAQQVDEIAAEQDFEKSVKLARNIAALNSISSRFADRTELVIAEQPAIDSMPIPKPVLTAPEKNNKTQDQIDETKMVELVIEVITSR